MDQKNTFLMRVSSNFWELDVNRMSKWLAVRSIVKMEMFCVMSLNEWITNFKVKSLGSFNSESIFFLRLIREPTKV
jgi:hypothetical protein